MTLLEAGRYLRAGNLTAAQDLYRRTLEEHPLQSHVGLGDAHFAAGEHQQALEHYYAAYQQGLTTPSLRQAILVSLFHHPLGPPEMDLRAFLEEALEWPDVDVQWALRAALFVIAGNFTVEEPLLRQVLRRCSLNTRPLEEQAARLRAWLQEHPDTLWCAAMAWQSAFNEYLLDATPEEEARLGAVTNEVELLVYAMYRDPAGLGELGFELSPVARELMDELVVGRQRERAFELPRLGVGCTSGSEHVRAQYEENPYPRWRNLHGCRQLPLSQWVPGGGPEVAEPEVLIAGAGTGQEPLTWAARLGPSARITAVDISAASLAYGRRRSEDLGMPVEFIHADILELGELGRQFDLIASSGVLHHLPDPAAGLRVLSGLLKPGGVMKLALYSRKAREGISAAQKLVAGQSLREARATLLALPDDDPAKQPTRFLDFYYLSGCRDMLFHAQEHLFDLAQIAEAMQSCSLELIGLEVPSAVARTYSTLFPEDLHRTNLHLWGVYEKLYPSTFELMYQFWCRKEAAS